MTIINITGGPIPDAGEPNPILIKHIEDLLDEAKRGRLQGVGTVCLWHDRTSSWHTVGLVGSFSMLGAATMLQQTLIDVNME